jgi:hypothetical protein
MTLANSWHEITLYQYLEIEKARNKTWDSTSELHIELISILLNTTPDDEIFDDMDWDYITQNILTRQWIFGEPLNSATSQLDKFKRIELNNLKLGEFIDCEYWIDNEESFKILPILFKQHRLDDWGNIQFEPYDYNIDERYELFLDTPVTKLYGILIDYINWRKEFLRSYENLFQEPSNKEEDTELTGRERIDAKVEELENKAKSKWSWESILLGLSNGDVTKFKDLFDTSLILVFNTLSAKKVLDI